MPTIVLGGEVVPYVIVRKQNKNAYVRVAPDGTLVVTAPRHLTSAQAEEILRRHELALTNARRRHAKTVLPEGMMLLWGRVVPRPALWSEASYRTETVRAAQAALVRWSPRLDGRIPVAGLRFSARLMKTRFGSIAPATKRVTLNSALARFDERYLEAIFLHELCHLAHPDHGKGFYQTLLTYSPEYRALRRELGTLFAATEV